MEVRQFPRMTLCCFKSFSSIGPGGPGGNGGDGGHGGDSGNSADIDIYCKAEDIDLLTTFHILENHAIPGGAAGRGGRGGDGGKCDQVVATLSDMLTVRCI